MRIGIFDSGIGGINVLKELVRKYPNNEYLFYGDTLNLPYGSKTINELKTYACNIIDYLIKRDVDLIIIACGTISSNCYRYLKKKYDIPIFDIVSPTIKYINNSNYEKVGVIATTRTINSKIFEIEKVSLIKATPSFVPIIEDSLIEESRDEIRSELSIFKDKVDALVLGCTHYPSLSKTIKEYLNVPLIDMGKCLTEVLELSLEGETVIDLYFSEISDKLISNVSNILECEYNLQGKVLDNKLLS